MNVSDSASETDAAPGAPSADPGVGPLPEALRSPRTKAVYLYLQVATRAGMTELKRSLGMPALALYPTLETLVEEGLVERSGDEYVVTPGRAE